MLFVLTLLHFTVDGICAAALAAYATVETDHIAVILAFTLYNLVAFGGQWLAGWLLDKKVSWLFCGLAIAVPFLLLGGIPALGMPTQSILLGTGNCIFHVAAGSLVLRRYKTYSEPGIFVSSGAIGLALGLNQIFSADFFLSMYVPLTCFALFKLIRSGDDWNFVHTNAIASVSCSLKNNIILLCVLFLLLGCVVLRGFGGGGASSYILIFPIFFALGKMLGGICCDRFGYQKTILLIFVFGCVALTGNGLVATLLLALAFNMTMPLTLRLLHWSRPESPGLMFGLAAGCLLPGAFFHHTFVMPTQAMLVIQFLSLFFAGWLILGKNIGAVRDESCK